MGSETRQPRTCIGRSATVSYDCFKVRSFFRHQKGCNTSAA
jgi:hypothetical protein